MENQPESKRSKRLNYVELEEDAERIFREFLEKDSMLPAKDQDSGSETRFRAISKSKRRGSGKHAKDVQVTIDLHGMRVAEACQHIEEQMDVVLAEAKGQVISFRFITGKGRHSGPEGGVLVREVYEYVLRRFAKRLVSIDAPPFETRLQGLPLRGYFDMKCRS